MDCEYFDSGVTAEVLEDGGGIGGGGVATMAASDKWAIIVVTFSSTRG